MKVVFEKAKCIGCGSCTALCPKYWEMGEDGRACLKNSKPNPDSESEELEVGEVGCNQEAVSVCPVECIHIIK